MKKRLLFMVALLTILMLQVMPAFAATGTAYRFWSDGTGIESRTFNADTAGQNAAKDWIDNKAKGYFSVNGSWYWVVLRDTKFDHKASANFRGYGYPYYNAYDPKLISIAIQYTLNLLPNYTNLSEDNYYGPGTTSVVKTFQNKHGMYVDGKMARTEYVIMCSTDY